MKAFVFGTGRCGSVAVASAFKFASNYSVSHEAYRPSLAFEDWHIAVNPQFRLVMPQLVAKHPRAWYVWLTRDVDKVIQSYMRLDQGRWLDIWWSFNWTIRPTDNHLAASIAVDRLVQDCERAYRCCPEETRTVWDIDAIKQDFATLWKVIGAQGDLDAALASFDTPINTSQQRREA